MRPFYLFCCLLFSFTLQAQVPDSLPPRMYADSAHAPFLLGVASADPLTDAVLIWTHITPDSATSPALTVNYEVADDTTFTNILTTGTAVADTSTDWTLTTDVTGLNPDTYYYYRFSYQGHYSRWGRTRTAPTGNVDSLRFAVISCSSIYSGYFNSYANIAKQPNLNAVIHMGDYIYNFVDADEQVRVPHPYPVDPSTKQEWQQRHAYYLLDPDLRDARAMHPFIVMWDNHDSELDLNKPGSFDAFRQWVPIRKDTIGYVIYRQLQYGNLADLTMIDISLFRDRDSIAPGETSILGLPQYHWLTQTLLNSTGHWHLVGSSKMVATWSAQGLDAFLPTAGPVFTTTTWDGYFAARENLMGFIEDNDIDNVMFLTGDMHMSFAMDIPRKADNSTYDATTGAGSVAVEFMPTSVSRGNLDEAGVSPSLAPVVVAISKGANPHHQYMDPIDHGYGILVLRADSAEAQYWYNPILQQSTQHTLGKTMIEYSGVNHWKRDGDRAPGDTTGIAGLYTPHNLVSDVRPNPNRGDAMELNITAPQNETAIIRVLNLQGRLVRDYGISDLNAGNNNLQFNTANLPAGNYFIYVEIGGYQYVCKFVRVE